MKIGVDTTFLVEASIREHPGHEAARNELTRRLDNGDIFVIAPQVIAEFVHVITDTRRFERPLSMPEGLEKARAWWNAAETEHAATSEESLIKFWEWMSAFKLGRKCLLDSMLAATYLNHGIRTIITSNARDYAVFGCFNVLVPGTCSTD